VLLELLAAGIGQRIACISWRAAEQPPLPQTGWTKQALSRLELGQRAPTWHSVQLLAAALGVRCEAFGDPDLELRKEEPAAPRGRPRKNAGKTQDLEQGRSGRAGQGKAGGPARGRGRKGKGE
jgi:hypothetical protein